MKTLYLIVLFSGTSVFAQIPSKLEILKAKRDQAIENVNAIYKDELKKLLDDPKTQADAQLMMDISDELSLPNPKNHDTNAEWFIGINWVTASGSKFNFTKTGRVIQHHNKNLYNFKWKFVKDQVVKVTGDFRDSSNSTERYFQFFPDGTAKYGATIENMIPIKRE